MVSACWSCSKAVCVTASLLPRNSTWDYWVSAETQVWFVWLGRAVNLIFECYFSFESVITLLQAMPGNGMLIVVNESVHLSKLCKTEFAEHNCSMLPPVSPLRTLMSLAFKSNGTKSASWDLRAFFSIQNSRQFLCLSQSQSHVISAVEYCQGSALADVFGTARGHWWMQHYGILNREGRVCTELEFYIPM